MTDIVDTGASVPDLRLRGDPPRVMRLSRKALALLGLVAGAGIGGSLLYALQPQHKVAAPELYKTDGQAAAEALAGTPKDYGSVPKLGPPLPGDLGRPIVSAQQRGVDVSAPPIGQPAGASGPGSAANAAQAARQRAQQERDSARVSKVFLGTVAPGGSAGAGMPGPEAHDLAALGSQSVARPLEATTSATAGDAQDDPAHKRAFLKDPGDRRTASPDRLTSPASPFTLQAGSVIPAALITGIRSDLPGQITAQVTENVYDSPTGRILLIPQGSRLIGDYDAQISFGQNRVLLAWNRLILPDGRSIALERQPGADPAGYAGLQDRVNDHWGGIARAALLSTILGVGAEVGSSSDNDLIRAVRQGTSDTVNQAGQQIVRRQLTIQPTLTIRPGYPVRVIVTRDLVLEPAASGDR